MGDVLSTGDHTFSYDVYGRPIKFDGVLTTYDALGRAVERNNNGAYTQVVYTPTGEKYAFMNGQTVNQYFVAMTAGAQLVYNATGLDHYRHADWQGSSRLASTPGQTVYYEGMYAPFGHIYGESGTTDRDFTGQTQDITLGLYDFTFRQQSPSQGRWLVPDPAGPAAVDITNPQTWNRYAYVANNPLKNIDPYGLELVSVLGADGSWYSIDTDTLDPNWLTYNDDGTLASINIPDGGFTGSDVNGNSYTLSSGSASWQTYNTESTTVSSTPINSVSDVVAANNGDVPLNPYAQAVFSQPVLQTTAATMTNPCTYVGWTAAAAAGGAAGVGVAHAGEITAAAADNAPTLLTKVLNWWFNFTSRPGKPGLAGAAVTTAAAAGNAVITTCKQF